MVMPNFAKVMSAVLLATLALAASVLQFSPAYTFNQSEKAYVSSSNPNTNYAAEAKVSWGAEQRKAWIKFDFSEIPSDATITSTTFNIYCNAFASALETHWYIGLYFASNAWSQTTLTWNNQPSIEASSWAEFDFGFFGTDLTGWHEKTSDTLKNRIEAVLQTDKKLTIVLQTEPGALQISPQTWYAYFTTTYINVEYTTPTPPTPPPPAPAPQYNLVVNVKDQCGNPLPAYVKADETYTACNPNGEGTLSFDTLKTVTVTATVNVGKQTFNTTKSVTLTGNVTTEQITIKRRFLWKFSINYTDGSVPFGKVIAKSSLETINVSISLGTGEALLLDTTYTLSFEASPQVNIGSLSPTNDGTYYATVDPETLTSKSSSSEAPNVSTPTYVTVPEATRALLLQLIYIVAILLTIAIIISVATSRARTKRKA